MSRRILDETTKSTFASDDYLYMDGQTDGSSKITPDNLVRNTTVAQQLAQHIADAEDDVEQITSNIETIQGDITDLRSDLGDLSELDTTDKSSIVGAINEVAGGSGSGLTADIKTALLQIAQKVAYIDANGQDYYDDLYDALYVITAITLNTTSITLQTIGATSQLTATTTPAGGNVTWSSSNTSVATVSSTGLVTSVAYGSATITATAGSVSATCSVVVAQATCTGITATYTQSGTVYDSDTLDSLKTDLVVTASWSNGTTSTLADTDYTLSGTLTEGTSTITVAYGGKTATFDVAVTHNGGIYPLDSGTYTFSGNYGQTITISNGNHVRVQMPTAFGTNGCLINLSDLTKNGSDASNNSSAINNLSDVLFTIPSNASVTLSMENVTKTKTEVIYTESGTGQFIITLRKTGTNTGVLSQTVGYRFTDSDNMSQTDTITSNTNVSCLVMYIQRGKVVDVEFDVVLTVNGERWI